MAVRSKVLALRGGLAGATTHLLFACPPERTGIVKEINLQSETGASQQITVLVQRGAQVVTVFRPPALITGEPSVSLSRNIVLEPGDQLIARNGTADATFRVMISGALLFGAPPA